MPQNDPDSIDLNVMPLTSQETDEADNTVNGDHLFS
jgi:hypothetical protein